MEMLDIKSKDIPYLHIDVRKRILIIVGICILASAGWFYYKDYSAKALQKAIDLDNQRLFDISVNDYHVAKYYADYNVLPENLQAIVEKEKNADENTIPLALVDPETKAEYTYQRVGSDIYKFCTTFSTDTLKDRNLADEYTDYIMRKLQPYTKSVYHKKGFDCIELSLAGNPESKLTEESTAPTEVFTFVAPQNGERVCLGSDYTLAWEGDKSTSVLGIYLVPPENLKQPESWILNGFAMSPGELVAVDDYSLLLQGSFVWNVGKLETYVGKTEPEKVIPGKNYQLGVVTTQENGSEQLYSSDYFEIANCDVASATTNTIIQ